MRVDLLFPVLPPVLDGIGDHTAHLARALAGQASVRVLTAQPDADPISGVEVQQGFEDTSRGEIRKVVRAVAADAPDWLILQYNPFSYGRYGFCPYLADVLAAIREHCPHTRIAILVHEPFVPLRTWQFALMTTWQRWQLWRLGHVADLVLCAIQPWTQTLRPYVASSTPLIALPVGSNIPDAGYGPEEARAALQIDDDALVLGIFGSARRLLGPIRAAVSSVASKLDVVCVLYVGPDGGRFRSVLGDCPLIDLGPLPALEVSRALAAMDVHLSPYPRGVSARRGAFIAGLQHGVPTVSTFGDHTDRFIGDMNHRAFVLTEENDREAFADAALSLARDESRRRAMADAARAMHDRYFAWDRLAQDLFQVLSLAPRSFRGGQRDVRKAFGGTAGVRGSLEERVV